MDKILQITAGRGPAECTWVAAQVLKKMIAEAQQNGLEVSVLQREIGDQNGTVETATISITGIGVPDFAASWIGTIQLGKANSESCTSARTGSSGFSKSNARQRLIFVKAISDTNPCAARDRADSTSIK